MTAVRTPAKSAREEAPGQPGPATRPAPGWKWLKLLREAVVPIEDFVSVSDRTSPEFAAYCQTRSRQLAQMGLACAIVTMFVLATTDSVVFRDSPEALGHVLAFRTVIIAVSAVMFLVLQRVSTGPAVIPLAAASFLVLVGVGFAFMGTLGGPERPFVFASFMIPFFPGLLRVPLGTRIGVTASGIAIMLFGFYAPHPAYWSNPNNAFLLALLSCITVGTVLAGDAFYRLERVAFSQRRVVERHAARLAELNRLKDGFVATVSHELRTPLTAILGLTEVVLEKPTDPQVPFYLKTVIQAGESLLTIINDILDLAKMKASKLTLRPGATDVATVVSQVAAILSVEAQRKQLSLSTTVPSGLPSLLLDGERLRQILINLVGNALKFTEQGGVRVVVTFHASELVLRVEDTGPGIPPEKLGTVFEEFEQLDSSSTRRHGGTGLGLPIVRRLAELMGGTAVAEANTPVGCVFVVRFPAPVAGPAVASASPPVPERRGVPQLLLADDTPDTRMMIEAFARQAGVRLDVAHNGEEALWCFAAGTYDLVLLDIEMPEKDGYAAARGMRALEREKGLSATPIVALTAHAGQDYGDRATEAGFSWHLTKPFRQKDFLELLGRAGLSFKPDLHVGLAAADEPRVTSEAAPEGAARFH